MSKMHGGKGDKPRPLGVSMEEFDRNFDAIFKKPYVRLEDGQDQKVVSKEIAKEIDEALGIKR